VEVGGRSVVVGKKEWGGVIVEDVCNPSKSLVNCLLRLLWMGSSVVQSEDFC